MIKKSYIFLLAFGLVATNIHFAKAQYAEDFRAKAVLEKQYTDIKGSPFLNNDFSSGVVRLVSGTSYKDIPLNYDQISGELVFRDKSGKTMGFADPVAEFRLTGDQNVSRQFRSGYKPVDANSDRTFYEVLYDGGTILLKDPRKNIVEHRSYNSSTVVKSIVETPAYYVLLNGQLVKIKKDKKALFSVLGKQAELDKYIRENKLNVKDDAGLVSLIKYYDSIKI